VGKRAIVKRRNWFLATFCGEPDEAQKQGILFCAMKILISGAGIAGPTLAYWLARYGFEPAVVEKAPQLRTGGYIIDFWGAGYDIADRMGLIPELLQKGYRAQEARAVNALGNKIASFGMKSFARALQDRYVSLSRGDLAASIYGKIAGKVETIFGDAVCGIEQSENKVRVSFEKSESREFDLVIGADGLHSRVREIVFGAESQFEKYLGYKVAAFGVDGYRPRDELVYVMHTEVGQQISRFAMHDDRTMFLFTFADTSPDIPADLEGQKALLKARFARTGWECPKIIEALDGVTELYFDRVSQIRMDPAHGLWTHNRVSLIGDAAFCLSLLAGQGAALAMVSAYIVAGELHRAGGDHRQALARYQELFAPFVAMKQKAALRFAGFFAPKSKLELFTRNQIMNLMRLPFVAELAMGRDMADKIEIPNY
jgi:2-polyprenyl-6-methoxyphenol hydroxylase-like FAD-dependent oxidoreductase